MAEKKNTPTPEEQITALQEQLAEVNAKAEALASEKESLTEELNLSASALEDKDKEIARLKGELEDSVEIVTDLKSQLKLAGKKSKGPIVQIGKKKYLVRGGFVNKEGRFTPEDIAADVKLAEALLKRGSTHLKEIK